MEKEYEEGRQSFFISRGANQNPHPAGSPAFNLFEAGWKQALNQHPGLFREYQLQKKLEEQRANEQKNEETRRRAEAYRKAKGC